MTAWASTACATAACRSRGNAIKAPSRCLPMPPCRRKNDSLMVESSGCAAFGHPAATQGSLSTTIGRRLGRQKRSVRPAFGVAAARDQSRCPCRARLVPLAAGASRVPPGAVRRQLMRAVATTAVSREKRRPRLRAAALSWAEGHATTARREPNPSQQHRVAERRHGPRLRMPCKPGRA
jgi:hypothetical protein